MPLPKVFKKIEGRTDMVYAGNIGIAQEWDLVVDLAKEIKNYPITISVSYTHLTLPTKRIV